ncbi:MAG: amino acid permease [Firmicutes bacterium]|nr:amino acid permease [Bacillota bacterium]HPU00493.1 amino acid permease [Bacillota bacterium]
MSQSEFGLKRVLGLWEVAAIAIGQTIGAGIFVMTGMAAGFTGPSVPLAYLLAAFPVVFLMLSLAMLGSALPTTGGNYKYASRLFSPRAAFIGVWGFMGGTLVGAFPLWALSGARYLQAVMEVDTVTAAVAIMTILFLVNLVGISMAAAVQALFVLLLLIALIMFGVAGIPHIDPANFTPFFPEGAHGFILATCVLIFTHLGANSIVELGGEIKNPGRVIPRAFMISIPLVTAIYLLVAVTAVGVVPWGELAGQPLTVAAKVFMNKGAFNFFVIGGGMLAIITTLNAGFMWGTKSLLVMAADGLFPRALTAVNRRFGTPHWFLLFIYLVSCGALIIFGEDYLAAFTILGSIGGIIIFLPVMGAALVLPKKAPEAYAASPFKLKGFWVYLVPSVGALVALGVMGMLLVDLLGMPRGNVFGYLFIIWLALGLAYYEIRCRALRRQGRMPEAVRHVQGREF